MGVMTRWSNREKGMASLARQYRIRGRDPGAGGA